VALVSFLKEKKYSLCATTLKHNKRNIFIYFQPNITIVYRKKKEFEASKKSLEFEEGLREEKIHESKLVLQLYL